MHMGLDPAEKREKGAGHDHLAKKGAEREDDEDLHSLMSVSLPKTEKKNHQGTIDCSGIPRHDTACGQEIQVEALYTHYRGYVI